MHKRRSFSVCKSKKSKVNEGDELVNGEDNDPANEFWIASVSSEDQDDSRSVNIDNTKNMDHLKMHYYREIIEHYSNQLR